MKTNIFRRARKLIDKLPALRLLADGASALPPLPQLRTLAEGSGVRIEIPAECGWSGREIETLLAENGITIWNKFAGTKTISFYVKAEQERWAKWVLTNRGPISPE